MDIQLIEWAGSFTGLAGAVLLATNSHLSRYGWFLFLASNALLIAFSLLGGHQGLLLMQCGFTLTSLLGIYRSWQPTKDELGSNFSSRNRRRYFGR
ncbi:MAG: nicotinamide mononucleotide transporter [Limnohabitans sp.]|jgi:hypothetical protein|uniref:nicotinamide mononucleotide transporter n=1 Tax=Limnohabitans sp. TaxID=1907725 RepID=UPI00391BBE93